MLSSRYIKVWQILIAGEVWCIYYSDAVLVAQMRLNATTPFSTTPLPVSLFQQWEWQLHMCWPTSLAFNLCNCSWRLIWHIKERVWWQEKRCLQGLIQGRCGAPGTRTAVSTVIVSAYKRKGYGARFSSAWSGLIFTITALLYVDDC